MRLASLIVLFALEIMTTAQEPTSLAAIPGEAAQKAALALVADIYKPDYEKAKTPAQKIELAKKLLDEGTATKDDLVGRFVLFRIARDIAAQQGDLAVSFDAIGRIGSEFEADILQLKVDVATVASKALKTPKDHQACATLLMPLIDEAVSVDRYDLAKSLVSLALASARGSRDSDLIKQTFSKLKEIDEVGAEFEKVKESKVALEAKPTDPAANFAVGKFLCFVKGDWRRGVTMLALGNDETFKATALLELEEKTDPLKLGDGWWKIAESLEETAKVRAQAHASEWYRKALPGLSGLTKARVERLIAQVPNTLPVTTSSTAINEIGDAKEIISLRDIDPKEVVLFQGVRFWWPNNQMKFSEATALATKVKGKLFSISNDSENDFVAKHQKGTTWIAVKLSGDEWLNSAGGKQMYFRWRRLAEIDGRTVPYMSTVTPRHTNVGVSNSGIWYRYTPDDKLNVCIQLSE